MGAESQLSHPEVIHAAKAQPPAKRGHKETYRTGPKTDGQTLTAEETLGFLRTRTDVKEHASLNRLCPPSTSNSMRNC